MSLAANKFSNWPDGQRWNRNFFIEQEYEGRLTFDQMSVCSFDKKICMKKKSMLDTYYMKKLSSSNVKEARGQTS